MRSSVVASAGAGGYWLAGADGGVYAFGDARFLGSLPGRGIRVDDVVGIVSPDAGGYLLVGADGSVYAFGAAVWVGSMAGQHLAMPVVGVASP